MDDALTVHRLHFAFTITLHYLFPQLTMGLALLIVILKSIALLRTDARYNDAARFWARIFGINFAMGVVTGIPMEFQFGTNWADFSKAAGGVIGQTLAMEGVFSFFLESSFLGLFLFGEKRLGPIGHWFAAAAAAEYGLRVGVVWWTIGMILVGVYFTLVYRHFAGKVSTEPESHGY
jgi:cytochrome d ubiquinol oxidase subunit I